MTVHVMSSQVYFNGFLWLGIFLVLVELDQMRPKTQ